VDDPTDLVACVVEVQGRGAKALGAAADEALAWLRRWSDYVRAAVSRPVTFVITSAEAGAVGTPSLTGAGRVRVPVAVPLPLPSPSGVARRLLLDLMLAGIIRAAEVAPCQPRREVWLPSDDDTDGEPHVLAGEFLGMAPNEMLLVKRFDDATDAHVEFDARLHVVVGRLPGVEVQDLSGLGELWNWVIAVTPNPDG
jgi:hypothetical protein